MSPHSSSEALPPLGFIGVQVPFTRPAGDAANPATWPFPLIREEADGTTLSDLVSASPYSPTFLANIVAAAHRLADRGCVGIITDCGFLALLQREVAEQVSVPLVSSALCQLPSVLAWLPKGKGIGVVTFDGAKLGKAHFSGAGVGDHDLERLWVVGVPENGVLRGIVEEARSSYDLDGVHKEIVESVKGLVKSHPNTAAVLLECTQMAPFAESVQLAVGLPVYDIYTLGCWFYQGLVRRRPDGWGPADGTGPYT